MTSKELDKYLNIIKTHRTKVVEYRHIISRLADGIAFDFSEYLEDAYIAAVSKLAGDTDVNWVDWYINENDFGRRGHNAGYNGKLSSIKTTRDLLRLIEEGKKKR